MTCEEHCQRCGTRNLVWHAPSPLWNAVMRWPDGKEASERWSIVCPQCFSELAEERGIVSNAAWCLNVPHGGLLVTLKTTNVDGKTWDPVACLWVEPGFKA